jgi:hypothetical protein
LIANTRYPAATSAHPRPAVGLDPDQHLPRPGGVVRIGELADQRVQPGDPGHPLRQPGLAQPSTRAVLHLHIVMIFSPVVADEQHHRSPSRLAIHAQQPWAITSDLMDKCSRTHGHDIPSAVRSPNHRQGHDLNPGLNSVQAR